MIVEIEHYRGDVMLTGKSRSESSLKRQFAEIEGLRGGESDNFTEPLCRRFGWAGIQMDEPPDYVYDRDVGILREFRW